MNTIRYCLRTAIMLSLFLVLVVNTNAQSTEFTYQGSLKDGTSVANGNYDFIFQLFTAVSGGAPVAGPSVQIGVPVTNGTFSVKLNFGNVFSGAGRFLDIQVRPNGSGGFTLLTPRQQITSEPYAVQALNASQLGGVAANQYVLTSAAIVNAATQFNINGNRVLGVGGTANTYGGVNAGANATNLAENNTFFGNSAGQNMVTAGGNSFFGSEAGRNTTSGGNSFFGSQAGKTNTSGQSNAFFGTFAGTASTGDDNAFFGRSAGSANTSGSSNSFFGRSAGLTNLHGTNNTALGFGADFSSAGLDFATAIGAGAVATSNNRIQLGRVEDSVRVSGTLLVDKIDFVGGSGGISVNHYTRFFDGAAFHSFSTFYEGLSTTLSSGGGVNGVCFVGSNPEKQLAFCGSSLRYKKNVESWNRGLVLIQRLRPVTFNWKQDNMFDLGFIAEEVSEVEPLLVTRNDDGKIEGVKYDRISAVLVNAVKEQQELIDSQKAEITLQGGETAALKRTLNEQTKLNTAQAQEIKSLKQALCSIKPRLKMCK